MNYTLSDPIADYRQAVATANTLKARGWRAEASSGGWVQIQDGAKYHRLSKAEARALVQTHKSYTSGMLDAARSSGGIGRYQF